jgi:alkaline phosphatase D
MKSGPTFRLAQQRFFDLLKRYQIKNPVYLSGDRHISQKCHAKEIAPDYRLYDATSSGLTHSYDSLGTRVHNPYRVSPLMTHSEFWNPPMGLGQQEYCTLQIHDEGGKIRFQKNIPLQ